MSGANSNDTATTEYDTAGRPSASTTADGYDPVPANRHSTTYAYTATTQTATLGTRWKRTTIDGFGRVSKVEAGHETTTESVVETEYAPCGCSPLGKVKRVSQPHAPGAAAKWTVYAYDGLGRTLTVTAADGSVTTYAYAGGVSNGGGRGGEVEAELHGRAGESGAGGRAESGGRSELPDDLHVHDVEPVSAGDDAAAGGE